MSRQHHIYKRRSCVPHLITPATSPSIRWALTEAGFCADCGRTLEACHAVPTPAFKAKRHRATLARHQKDKLKAFEAVTR